MLKKIVIILAILVVLVILLEVIALFRLKASLASYAQYWKHYPTTGTFTYVALGDSGAQGIGASKPERGYVGLLAQQIQQTTGKTVRIVNLSVSGSKIQDVIDKQLPQLKNYKADLITIEVGSNDVVRYDDHTFQAQYNVLATAVPPGTIVSNIPYFGGRIRKNSQALAASQHIHEAASKHHLRLVDLQSETRQRQSVFNYAADWFHPNDRGYKNWEAAFWKTIEPALE